jgi:hypothetical protein
LEPAEQPVVLVVTNLRTRLYIVEVCITTEFLTKAFSLGSGLRRSIGAGVGIRRSAIHTK